MSSHLIPFFEGDDAPLTTHPLYWNYPVWLRVDPSCSGVYVLIDKPNVVYVGKTINLGKRLLAHHVIDFRTVRRIIKQHLGLYIWPCSDPFMSILEAYLIYCFRPKHNTVYPSTSDIGAEDLEACGQVLKELTELVK